MRCARDGVPRHRMHGRGQDQRLEHATRREVGASAEQSARAVWTAANIPATHSPEPAAGHQRRPFRRPALTGPTRHGLQGEVGRGPVRPRAVRAEIGDGRDDGTWVQCPQLGRRQAPAMHCAATTGSRRRACTGRRQLSRLRHHHRSRPCSQELEQRSVTACRSRNATTRAGVASRILHAHDLGAAVGEQPRAVATGDVTGQTDHFGRGYCGAVTCVVLPVVSGLAAAMQSSNHLRTIRISRSPYSFEQPTLRCAQNRRYCRIYTQCDVGLNRLRHPIQPAVATGGTLCSSFSASTTTSSSRQTYGPNVCQRSSRRRAPTSSRPTDASSGCTRTSARPPWD